jgi:hypothetical protein
MFRRRSPEEDVEKPMAPPFWVIGAPRSGTTFLARVLNHHPEIFLTNETRVMLLFSRMLSRWVEARRLLATSKQEIVESLWRQTPGVIEQVYRDLGARPGQRWGDKYPQYADGDQDPEALATIDRLFPESQYIHIIRDPRAVVASIVAKEWLGLDEAVQAWRAFVTQAQSFGSQIGANRYLEVRFENLVTDGPSTAEVIFSFLGLRMDREVEEFLQAESHRRTPVSAPMGTPGSIGRKAWSDRLLLDQVRAVEESLKDLMSALGYSSGKESSL